MRFPGPELFREAIALLQELGKIRQGCGIRFGQGAVVIRIDFPQAVHAKDQIIAGGKYSLRAGGVAMDAGCNEGSELDALWVNCFVFLEDLRIRDLNLK